MKKHDSDQKKYKKKQKQFWSCNFAGIGKKRILPAARLLQSWGHGSMAVSSCVSRDNSRLANQH
jgi:hypothetical protein